MPPALTILQNKMHWAAHGQTAAEIIYARVDADKPNMGLTSWSGETIRKNETEIAKNYLNEKELDILNRIVTLYIDFAELQALNQTPMKMKDWIAKLDDFLKLSGRDILSSAGKISRNAALTKAHDEFEKFKHSQLEKPTEVEKHFIEAEKELKQIENAKMKDTK